METHTIKIEVFELSIHSKSNAKKDKDLKISWKQHLLSLCGEEKFLPYFMEKIDLDDYYVDTTKRKALTAYSAKDAPDKTITTRDDGDMINGFLNGGSFGRRKTKAKLSNKKKTDPIYNDDVVGDDFYFLLYLPTQLHNGIIVIQSYKDSNMRGTFIKFLENILETETHRIKHKQFLPKVYKELFENNFLLKSATFNSTFVSDNDNDSEEWVEEANEYNVRITITPKKEMSIKGMDNITKYLSNALKYKFGRKPLGEFDKQKVTIGDDGPVKGGYLDLSVDNDLKIQPVVYFDDIVDRAGVPDFKQIRKKCYQIFDYAKAEIYPI